MNYLTPAQVLFIHHRLIVETGGRPGVRDLGVLAQAVVRPQATVGDFDIYQTVNTKAAALLESLVFSRPFIEGNQRVGFAAAGLFLCLNAQRLVSTQEEAELFMIQVARRQLTIGASAAWLFNHTIPLESRNWS